MTRRPRSARTGMLAAMIVLVVSGCGGDASGQSPGLGSARPDPSGGPGPVELTPWESELANVEADGTRSIESALTLFAMAFGPIPGVDAEAADAAIGSATPGVRVLRANLDLLDAEQRTAVERWLEMAAEADEIAIPPADADAVGMAAGATYASSHAGGPVAYPYGDEEAFERGIVEDASRVRSWVASYWGDIPDLFVRPYDFGPSPFITFFNPTIGPGGLTRCDVFVNTSSGNVDRFATRRALTFDVVHCFQSWKAQSEAGFEGLVPGWAWEGPAEYLNLEMWPVRIEDTTAWTQYLTEPATPLFARTYDAVGYYAQLRAAGLDVGAAMAAVLTEASNEERFALAGTTANEFLDRWAPGLARADWGGDWAFESLGMPARDVRAPWQTIDVEDGSIEAVSQDAYANSVYLIYSSVDLVRVEFTGRARISDGNVDIIIRSPVLFCTSDEGCESECPDGAPLPVDRVNIQPASLLAVSGGTDGTSGTISGTSLLDECPTPRPSPSDDGEFCRRYHAFNDWAQSVGPITEVTDELAQEVVAHFTGMHPYAPPEMVEHVEIVIVVYRNHDDAADPYEAPLAGVGVTEMYDGLLAIDAYCGGDRGR